MRRRELTIDPMLSDETWSGQVELPNDDHQALEAVWRLFNRVDPEDVERLEKWGYLLPSLSVGDRVRLDGQDYWVDDFGWVESEEELPEFIKRLKYLRSGKSWS